MHDCLIFTGPSELMGRDTGVIHPPLFIEDWPQDFYERASFAVFEIWLFQWLFPITTLKLTGSKTQPFKVPFEWYFREKLSCKISQQRPQYYKSNNKKANMPAFPVNQMCLFASMDNALPEVCDIKNIKVNSFPWKSIFFSSVKVIQNVIR